MDAKVDHSGAPSLESVAVALRRAEKVLRRRPSHGLHDDMPAAARWDQGTRVVTSHENGTEVRTDMPGELGGAGADVTPGWLFRAALASCAVTRIAMGAATGGMTLTVLEVVARSRSDLRGVLGMPGPGGDPVGAGPSDVQLLIRIAAPGQDEDALRALVLASLRCSPISHALASEVPMDVQIEFADA